jgi:hypothetical protein
MREPTEEEIKAVKDKYPDRALVQLDSYQVDKDDIAQADGETIVFVFSGPSRPEYDRFTQEIEQARSVKGEAAKSTAIRDAIEKAVTAQIRWPARTEVQEIFAKYPALSVEFAEHLHRLAGASFRVREKHL